MARGSVFNILLYVIIQLEPCVAIKYEPQSKLRRRERLQHLILLSNKVFSMSEWNKQNKLTYSTL